MALLNLPEELLLQILGDGASHRLLETPDYAALSLVSKHIRDVVRPLLYRRLEITLGNYMDEKAGATDRLARGRLLTEPDLGSYVREFSIKSVHGQVEYANESVYKCLEVVRYVQDLTFGYCTVSTGSAMDKINTLLCSGFLKSLNTLKLTFSLCGCQILPLFSIPTLGHLHLGYYRTMEQDRCQESRQNSRSGQKRDHSHLMEPNPAIFGTSFVWDLSISTWQPDKALETIIKLPKKLVHFAGTWRPWDNPYSAKSVSDFLSAHRSTLCTLDIGASLDKDDEYEPQESDGGLASFADFTALEKLQCHVDVLLGEDFTSETAAALADRLPDNLQKFQIYYVPRMVSAHAHKPDIDMNALDSTLVWLRSLSRAKHERKTALQSVTFSETAYLPGPLCGPYLRPQFEQRLWEEDEQTAWSERGAYPFEAVDIRLQVWLVFVIRGWTRTDSVRRTNHQARLAQQDGINCNVEASRDDNGD